jgi:ribosomal protein S27E
MTTTYECPRCHEDVPVKESQTQAKCPACRAILAVQHDGEWELGLWIDRTTLTVVGISLGP